MEELFQMMAMQNMAIDITLKAVEAIGNAVIRQGYMIYGLAAWNAFVTFYLIIKRKK